MADDKPNLNEIMKKAQEMQKNMQEAHDQLIKQEFIGKAGAGMVEVAMNGRHEGKWVKIQDAAMMETKEVLQDLITAAITDAAKQVETESQKKMVELTQKLGMPGGQEGGQGGLPPQ